MATTGGYPILTTVATIGFDGFGDEDFVPAFQHIPELGVMDIEFNCWYPRNLTPEGIESIRRRSAEIGARPAALHVGGFVSGTDFADVARETTRWMWVIEAARRLDVRVLKATGVRRGDRGGLDGLIEVLRTVAPVATDSGVRIALENHHRNVLEVPQDYERVFDAIDEESVGLCLDTGHFAASGVDMFGMIDQFADRLVHIDLKDCRGSGATNFVRYGEGDVDFDGLLAHAIANGFAGQVVIEFPRLDERTMIDDLRAGAAIAARHVSRR